MLPARSRDRVASANFGQRASRPALFTTLPPTISTLSWLMMDRCAKAFEQGSALVSFTGATPTPSSDP